MSEKNKKPNIPEHIGALYLKYIGLRNEQIADLRVFLEKPTGVGDHESVSASIEKIVSNIESYDAICATIKNLFPTIQEDTFGTPQPTNQRAKSALPPKQKTEEKSSNFGDSSKMFYNLQAGEEIKIDQKNKTIVSDKDGDRRME